MPTLHHHSDRIIVTTESGQYNEAVTDFDLDRASAGVDPLPALPVGMNERRYSVAPGSIQHTVHDGVSQFPGEVLPLPYADTVFSAFDALCIARDARVAAAKAQAEQELADKLAADYAARVAAQQGAQPVEE